MGVAVIPAVSAGLHCGQMAEAVDGYTAIVIPAVSAGLHCGTCRSTAGWVPLMW